jgi:hypothetical protein
MTGYCSPNLRMIRGVGHAHQRPEPQAAATKLDAFVRRFKQIDVDDRLRPHHIELIRSKSVVPPAR